jgi:hypothetical protein
LSFSTEDDKQRVLYEEELEELDLLKRSHGLRALDGEELVDLRRRKSRNKEIDEDLLYELEIFDKKERGVSLDKDKQFKIKLFKRKRQGGLLNKDEIQELEMLKGIRED